MRKVLLPVLALLTLALACGAASWADTAVDPLHGQCNGTGGQTCTDTGVVTPLGNSTTYGFTISPGPQTGDLRIVILLPDNYTAPAGGFAITPTINATIAQGGADWNTGDLDTFLGISASPSNPIGAYLGLAQGLDPLAAGFFVFVADLGSTTIPDNSNASSVTGEFTLPSGLGSDLGAFIVGFCGTGCTKPFVATANSGALIVNGTATVPSPEPGSLTFLGAGLLGLALLAGRRVLTV
jgi:hypothetical protein